MERLLATKRTDGSLSKGQAFLSRATALIILLPFFVISFFNHPLGDDYWSTGMVRRLGFLHAQVELYNTVPPRWLALGLSCFSPLSWGNFWGYKVIPVVFLLLFIAAMAGLFRTLSGYSPGVTRKSCYELAILFTAVFLSAAPGIGGGIYWVSALIVFGIGLLLFVCWVNLLVMWYRGRRSRWVLAGIGVCFLAMAGSNEIITVVSLVILGVVNLYRIRRKRGIDRATVLLLSLLGLSVGFVACFKGAPHRLALMQTTDSAKFWYSAGFSILVSGFCVLKALISPFCLAALIAAYDPFIRWCRSVYGVQQELLNAVSYFTAGWLFILFTIPFTVLYLSGLHPPYRVVNMVFFFQLIGLMYFGTRATRGRGPFAKFGQYRNIAVALLLISGFMCKNNVSIAVRELVSGNAYQYDKEMNQRYQLILKCRADSCVVPYLRHTSITLRYDSADVNDFHISDYFQKKVIVR